MNSTDFGTTEDQVEALIRKHEAFDKVLEVQEEKVSKKSKVEVVLFLFIKVLPFYVRLFL